MRRVLYNVSMTTEIIFCVLIIPPLNIQNDLDKPLNL